MVSWTAPDVTRIDEPFTGPERGILDGFLDWHRATLLWKCAGLTGEQLALGSVTPTNLSLLGIVRHVADTERAWIRIRFRGEPLPRLYDYEDVAFEHADPAGPRRTSRPSPRNATWRARRWPGHHWTMSSPADAASPCRCAGSTPT